MRCTGEPWLGLVALLLYRAFQLEVERTADACLTAKRMTSFVWPTGTRMSRAPNCCVFPLWISGEKTAEMEKRPTSDR